VTLNSSKDGTEVNVVLALISRTAIYLFGGSPFQWKSSKFSDLGHSYRKPTVKWSPPWKIHKGLEGFRRPSFIGIFASIIAELSIPIPSFVSILNYLPIGSYAPTLPFATPLISKFIKSVVHI
jgi:hypothetical protein